MATCPSCNSTIPDERQACPSCGTIAALVDAKVPLHEAETRNFPAGNTGRSKESPSGGSRSAPSLDSLDGSRFAPGTMIAERYRIVGLLGRGGMGEVYRADDLKLGQMVALKFLPDRLATDGAALARFHREVRVARNVSHRNVCRVYDVGETGGHTFLSMEYINGEELSSLLRRIGRLPHDKALEISRQLCAGLAAAHDNNVLHRDLKPSNVMIDGDGNVRILDFGLAGLSDQFAAEELRAGTPAYMAPEQLAGKDVSVRSDIYSLGLVIYEAFTGKRAFEAPSLADLIALRKSDTSPTSPSNYVKDIDPLVERVIQRCLSTNPEDRPTSAIQVAASLPGGDPLAAALAAGETPSPEMVAAAPTEGVLRPAVAVGLLASFFILLVASIWLAGKVMLYSRVPLNKSPDVMQERARDIAKRVGNTGDAMDSEYGFFVNLPYLAHINENDNSPARWDKLATSQPPSLCFWYRQSPYYLEPWRMLDVTFLDPPMTASGMFGAVLDTEGRLVQFFNVPPQKDETQQPNTETPQVNWAPFFIDAGLDLANFRSADSQWTPPSAYDARTAWVGVYPQAPQLPVRVEAASYRGKPVYFDVVGIWDRPTRQEEPQLKTREKVLVGLLLGLFIAIVIGGALLAVRNLHLGRGDRSGAFKLALFVFCLNVVEASLWHHVPTFGEWLVFGQLLKNGLLLAAFFWLLYIALEPFVRRRWPGRIVSWMRLAGGNFRDPLVGHDVLIGALFGISFVPIQFAVKLVPGWLGYPSEAIAIEPASTNLGLRSIGLALSSQIQSSLLFGFGFLFLLLLLTIILKREWLAAVALWLIVATALTLAWSVSITGAIVSLIGAALLLFPLVRYGALAMISAQFYHHLWIMYPMTFKLTAWYAGAFTVGLMISVALLVYAFYISLAGQPLLRAKFLED